MSVSENWEMICPACGADDCLSVQALIWVKLRSDGTEDEGGDHEWDKSHKAECGCGWSGTIQKCQEAFTVADAPEFDCNQAMSEGWGIFETGERWEIEKDDESGIFSDDDSAEQHVHAQATMGSQYHRDALNWLRLANIEED